MSRYALKFPFRVRIHGGEFDESARAIHREDGLKTIQAESGIVLESTIERKQMSTKTTFKRIALVTVAALGFGVMSVAPSNAAADSTTLGAATSTATIGTAVTNTVTLSGIAAGAGETITATVVLLSAPATSTAAGVLPAVSVTAAQATANAAANADTLTATGVINVGAKLAGRFTGSATISVTPDVAGTYVYRVTPSGTGVLNVTAQTWTVTAAAVGAVTAADSTSVLNAGETVAASTDATINSPMALAATAQVGTIVVTSKNAALTDLSSTTILTAAIISGPGMLGISDSTTVNITGQTAVGRAITGTAGQRVIGVFADGTSGKTTVQISAGTTVLATETLNFYGAAASITPTVVNSVLNIGVNAGAVTAIVKDKDGALVQGTTVYAISGTDATIDSDAYQSCGASDATGLVTCPLTGVAAGTATITLSLNSSSTGTSTVSALAGTMRVSSGVATKVEYSFDKTSYAPGEAAVITATVSDAVGVLGAGTYTVLTAGVTANYSMSGLPTTTVAASLSTGKATYNVTIPTGVTGPLKLTGTAATGVTATFGSVEVVNAAQVAAQEATDAALEAIDAGNNAKDAADQAIEAADAATIAAEMAAEAATEAGLVAVAAAEAAGEIATEALDAANAATDAALSAAEAADAATAAATEAKESADAATAAVAALSAEVTKLMAALTAKVTTLSTLVAKIAKKVKA
jgi:hypothetical protein